MSLRPYSQRVLTTALVVCTWLAWPPCVTAQEANWVLRIQGTWSNPTNTFETIGQDAVAISAESNEPFGIAAALEYRFDALLGVELGGGYSRPRIDVSASNDELTLSAIATTRFTPLTAGLNLHVVSNKSLDLYGGVMAVAGFFGNLSLDIDGDRAFIRGHSDLGFGLQAGVDVPMGRRGWALSALVRYMRLDYSFTDTDGGNTFAMHFNPFVAGFGVSARF